MEIKLGYKFQDESTLIFALTHESSRSPEDPPWSKVASLEPMGKHLIQLYATDYVIRTSRVNMNRSGLESQRNYLCGQTVMRDIAKFLDLKTHIRLAQKWKHDGRESFQRYEEFVNRLFAAAYVDSTGMMGGPATESDLLTASLVIQEMFCRLWNPYLKQCPTRHLEELFPPSFESQATLREKLGCTISDEIPTEIEKCMIYTFTNRQLLHQALTDRQSRFYCTDSNVGDSVRFQILGESALNFTVSAGRFSLQVNNIACNNFEETRAHQLRLLPFDYELFKRYYLVPPGTNVEDVISDEGIALSLLGAMYVDNTGNAIFRLTQIYCYFTNLLMFFTLLQERRRQNLELTDSYDSASPSSLSFYQVASERSSPSSSQASTCMRLFEILGIILFLIIM